jgi:hypothetical protein
MRVFEEDKKVCEEVTMREWQRRSWRERMYGVAAGLLRSQL